MTTFLRGSSKLRVVRCPDEQLCIRFANTIAWRGASRPEERLGDANAVLKWMTKEQVVEGQLAKRVRDGWAADHASAARFWRVSKDLREAIYRLFCRQGVDVDEGDIEILNACLGAATSRGIMSVAGEGLGWQVPESLAVHDVLAPIAWSAADLLVSLRSERIRRCADDRGCGWLFFDASRAGTRRWCSMGDCGNRAKARRNYLRKAHRD